MSLPLELTLALKPSKDCLKCIFFLYGVTFYSIGTASISDELRFIFIICFIIHGFKVLTSKNYLEYQKVMFIENKWLLFKKEEINEFTKARISFSCGLFILLTFSKGKIKKNLIIFRDQINAISNKHLHLLIKINLAREGRSTSVE